MFFSVGLLICTAGVNPHGNSGGIEASLSESPEVMYSAEQERIVVSEAFVEAEWKRYDRKFAEPMLASELDTSVLAQFDLGADYFLGKMGDRDYKRAFESFLEAAEQGLAEAQYTLGLCYYNGQGVSQNYAEAEKWLCKAAEQGNVEAQCTLGACYYIGQVVPQNYAEAVKWLSKGAEQGNAEAQCILGVCYYAGRGVLQDYDEAVKWFRLSAEQGDSLAKEALKELGESY